MIKLQAMKIRKRRPTQNSITPTPKWELTYMIKWQNTLAKAARNPCVLLLYEQSVNHMLEYCMRSVYRLFYKNSGFECKFFCISKQKRMNLLTAVYKRKITLFWKKNFMFPLICKTCRNWRVSSYWISINNRPSVNSRVCVIFFWQFVFGKTVHQECLTVIQLPQFFQQSLLFRMCWFTQRFFRIFSTESVIHPCLQTAADVIHYCIGRWG